MKQASQSLSNIAMTFSLCRESCKQGLQDGLINASNLFISFMIVGAASVQYGLSLIQAVSMTVFIFAAPAQLAIIELLKSGADLPQIAIVVALINSRFTFMAAILQQKLKNTNSVLKLVSLSMLTATTFAILSFKCTSPMRLKDPWQYFFCLGLSALTFSVAGTIVGIQATAIFPDSSIDLMSMIVAIFLVTRLAGKKLSMEHLWALLGFCMTPVLQIFLGSYALIATAIFWGSISHISRRLRGVSL